MKKLHISLLCVSLASGSLLADFAETIKQAETHVKGVGSHAANVFVRDRIKGFAGKFACVQTLGKQADALLSKIPYVGSEVGEIAANAAYANVVALPQAVDKIKQDGEAKMVQTVVHNAAVETLVAVFKKLPLDTLGYTDGEADVHSDALKEGVYRHLSSLIVDFVKAKL